MAAKPIQFDILTRDSASQVLSKVRTEAASRRVDDLRSTWRTTAEQKAAQAYRVLRLFVIALVGQVLAQLTANGFDLDKVTHLDQKAIVALLVAAGEAAWRQLHPALTASGVDTAPGATIVPPQVEAPDLSAPDDTLDVDSIPADLT